MSENLVKNPNSIRPQEIYGYVYQTLNKTNGKIYIGQHAQSEFDKNYYGSGKLLLRALKKYGKENFDCFVLCWCSSKEILDQQEKLLIELFNSDNLEIGYNLTSGGISGYKYNLETKQKMSKVFLERDEESKIKLKKQMSDIRSKKVICLQTLEVFDSIKQAAEAFNTSSSYVSLVLKKQRSNVKGFSFEFFDEKKDYTNFKEDKIAFRQKACKEVICLQTLKIYPSAKQAAKELDLRLNSLSQVLIKQKRSTKGYNFEYYTNSKTYKTQEFFPIKGANKKQRTFENKKAIFCHQNAKIYESIKEATQDLNLSSGSISAVINKHIKHFKGYTFEVCQDNKVYENQLPQKFIKNKYNSEEKAIKIKCNETEKVYNSLKEAAKELKVDLSNFSHHLNGRKLTVSGYTFVKV